MIVAIPAMDEKGLDSEICEHFGHSNYYYIIEVKKELPPAGEVKKNLCSDEEIKIKLIKNERTEQHTCSYPVNLIACENADYLITSGIGGAPFGLFKQRGIKLYAGAFGTVREALRDFLCGMLQPMEMASCGGSGCGHH
ncbi:MAG: NifB/NifX family molybdenum-iron cluster-binding protein [Candidatus Helarchaeota archaeon]